MSSVWFCFYTVLRAENYINQDHYLAVFPDANWKLCSNCLGFWVRCRRELICLDLGFFCMILANEGHILL